jgi:HK97 family phage major capsid protein
MNRKQLLEALQAKSDAFKAITVKTDATLEEKTTATGYVDEMKSIRAQIDGLDRFDVAAEEAKNLDVYLNGRGAPAPTPVGASTLPDGEYQKLSAPARARRFKSKSFTGPDRNAKAYAFGQVILATCFSNAKAVQYCKDNGLALNRLEEKSSLESVNSSGGFLVPDIFEDDLIDLREKYGVFRPLARRRPMTSDTSSRPRRKGGLTSYYVGEGQIITNSDKTWDRVRLTAKKLATLTYISNELDEDSVIDLGDDLAKEIAYAFAIGEDDAGFNGDGTSTYGGIVGVRTAFTNLSATIANIAGLQVASGAGYASSYGSIALADFNAVMGRLPEYADTDGCGWICHKSFFNGTMQRLEFAGGGNTELNIAKGQRDKMFLGYPVHVAQKMPSQPAVSQVVAIFGDLALAADFGDRRATTIAMSEHVNFTQDEIAIRGTERYDINVHDVGNASATASLRVPGPVVALITAAS